MFENLVGLKLNCFGRAADMAWFAFCSASIDAEYSPCIEYDLHIQCPWRLIIDKRIISGYSDIFCPGERFTLEEWESQTEKHFSYDERSVFDESVYAFRKAKSALIVTDAQLKECNDLLIRFNDSACLQIFVDQSITEAEQWRLFNVNSIKENYVVYPLDINDE